MHVGVDVAGDRVDDSDPVLRVLQDTGLLDVHLDPAREVVERMDRLAPTRRLVPCCFCVLPEAATVVDRAKRLPELLLAHALQHDAAAEQHLAEAGALLLEERDQLKRQAELVLRVEAAHLEGGDDAHRAVVASPVPVRVAVRADAERRLAGRPVSSDERPDRILEHVEVE